MSHDVRYILHKRKIVKKIIRYIFLYFFAERCKVFLTMKRSPIADHIEALMDAQGLTKAEISRRSGVSRVYLSDLFNGKSKEPRHSNIVKIAGALGVPVEDIYAGTTTITKAAAENGLKTHGLKVHELKAGGLRTGSVSNSAKNDRNRHDGLTGRDFTPGEGEDEGDERGRAGREESFSGFLVHAMQAAKITSQQLAGHFGLPSQAVSLWQSGKNKPAPEVADAVRNYLMTALSHQSSIVESSLREPSIFEPSILDRAPVVQHQRSIHYGMVRIPQYDIEAAAGAGLEPPDYQDPARIWTMPREALSGISVSSLNNLAIITVRGESMMPDYQPGEYILIDLGDKTVTHDGAYVLFNSYGLVVKLVQLLPATAQSEPKVRIISKNPDFPPYEMNATDIHISGRVVGKWVWK